MVNKTAIEWTDFTSNPVKYRDRATGKSVWGCIRKSPGCAHCYAADLAKRYGRGGAFIAEEMAGYECYVDEKELRELLSPKRLPAGSKCFLGDMTDVFGEWVQFEQLDRVFAVMALRPDVVFQVLTKRPERMRQHVSDVRHGVGNPVYYRVAYAMDDLQQGSGLTPASLRDRWPLPNVWLGVSAENQRWADVRIPELLATPAAVRFVSYEPALGPVDFAAVNTGFESGWGNFNPLEHPAGRIDWVIVGGESGPGARPFDIAWARSTVAQCRAAGVAVFYKQGGKSNRCPHSSKGGCLECFPADLQIREFPNGNA